jgi:hypothetical protein
MPTPREKVECGLWLIEEAIMELLTQRGDWVKHSEIQDELNLRSEYKGGYKGFLSGRILERLVEQNRVVREGGGRGRETRFRIANSTET